VFFFVTFPFCWLCKSLLVLFQCLLFFGLWYFMMTSRDLLNFIILFVFIKHASSWHLTFTFFIVFMFNETFFTWTLFTSFFFLFCCFLGRHFFVLQCCEGFVLVSTSDHYFSLSRACSFCNIGLFFHVLCWQHSSSNFCYFFNMAFSSTKNLGILFKK